MRRHLQVDGVTVAMIDDDTADMLIKIANAAGDAVQANSARVQQVGKPEQYVKPMDENPGYGIPTSKTWCDVTFTVQFAERLRGAPRLMTETERQLAWLQD